MKRLVRVMIADDDELIATTMSAICTSLSGVTLVGCVENGEEVVEKLPVLSPDVLLLDIHMPKLSGIDALKRVKEMDPEVMVIMLTAESDADVVRNCLRGGASNYILKTNPPDKIRSTIRDMCFKRLQEITKAAAS